jgi:hypothetical protein
MIPLDVESAAATESDMAFGAARHPKNAGDFDQASGWRRFKRSDMKESKGSFYG